MVKDKYILGYSGLAYYDERIKDYISNISHSESGLTQEIIARQSGDTFLLETKQDKLEEGHGIVIENNVISTNIINDETVETGKTYSSVKIMDIVNGVSFAIEIVDELPISGEPRTIYFVPKEESGETSNIYYEYLYINNEWEKIGDTEIDLSGYYTKEEIDEIIDSIYDDLLTLNSGLTEVVDFVNTLATIIETKQDKLTSGYNIRISGNTIEAIGYKYEEETGDFTIKTNPAIGSRLPLPIGDSEDVNSVNVRQDGDVFIIGVGGYEGDNEESSIALQDVINNSISAITIADSALSIEIENRIAGDTILEESINELSGVVDEIETELDGKQDKLTAGDNISTKNNTISAIGYHFDETKGSFAEGSGTTASFNFSHAEGLMTSAGGMGAHAEGVGTQTINTGEHAEGSFNQTHAFTVSTIGIGTNNDNRKNAVEVLYTGDVYINGIGGYNGSEITSGTTKTLQSVIENIGEEISVTVEEVLNELNNED